MRCPGKRRAEPTRRGLIISGVCLAGTLTADLGATLAVAAPELGLTVIRSGEVTLEGVTLVEITLVGVTLAEMTLEGVTLVEVMLVVVILLKVKLEGVVTLLGVMLVGTIPETPGGILAMAGFMEEFRVTDTMALGASLLI